MGWGITYNKQQCISGKLKKNYFFYLKYYLLTSFSFDKPSICHSMLRTIQYNQTNFVWAVWIPNYVIIKRTLVLDILTKQHNQKLLFLLNFIGSSIFLCDTAASFTRRNKTVLQATGETEDPCCRRDFLQKKLEIVWLLFRALPSPDLREEKNKLTLFLPLTLQLPGGGQMDPPPLRNNWFWYTESLQIWEFNCMFFF